MNEPDRWHGSDGFDADAMFADIVAHLNDDAVEPERLGTPSTDDATAHDEVAGDSATGLRPGPSTSSVDQPPVPSLPSEPEALPTPQVWRASEVDDEYEEHFEPLPVAPLPLGDLQFWGIIAGMGGGPLFLLYLMLFNRDAGNHWILASIAMSVGGFALLVLRLPSQQEDGDDGARL